MLYTLNHRLVLKSVNRAFLAIEMKKKKKVLTNKPVYLQLLILEVSKALMYWFWYDYVKPKYRGEAKLCFMDTDLLSLIVFSFNVYVNVKKLIGLMKNESGGNIMTKFVGFRAKTCI